MYGHMVHRGRERSARRVCCVGIPTEVRKPRDRGHDVRTTQKGATLREGAHTDEKRRPAGWRAQRAWLRQGHGREAGDPERGGPRRSRTRVVSPASDTTLAARRAHTLHSLSSASPPRLSRLLRVRSGRGVGDCARPCSLLSFFPPTIPRIRHDTTRPIDRILLLTETEYTSPQR
jgi:hypothetical protein